MAIGKKAFMVAAFMAIAALFGSIGASSASTLPKASIAQNAD